VTSDGFDLDVVNGRQNSHDKKPMHTIMVVTGGFALLGLFALVARVVDRSPSALAAAAKYFIPIWLIAAGINMWFGVTQAGYSVAAEAPIFLLVFALPAAAAAWLWWSRTR
jgi:hypothetical protein